MTKSKTGWLLLTVLLLALWPGCRIIHDEARWKKADEAGMQAFMKALQPASGAEARYAEAERHWTAALREAEKFGGQDRHLASSLKSPALLYHRQGKYAKAEPLFLRAIAIDEKAFGPEHGLVGESLYNLAALYQDQGKYAEAEQIYKRLLADTEKVLGLDAVATPLNSLAELYLAQGRYAEAEPLLKRAIEIEEKARGPESVVLTTSLDNLAELYRAQGRYAEAEPLLKRVKGSLSIGAARR